MDQLKNAFADFTGLSQDMAWIALVAAVVFVVVLTNFILAFILRRVERKTKESNNVWDDAFFYAVALPLRLMVWIIGLSIAIEIVRPHAESPELFALFDPARHVAVIAALALFLLRLVKGMQISLLNREVPEGSKGPDRDMVDAVGKLLRVTIVITAVLVVLQTLGFSVSGVLAFGGVGGIAVGFAAKDMLANFFGGLMIYLDRPFGVGDWIRSPDQEIEGTVEQIGWRRTVIRTFDKRPLYVPNAVFNQVSVENPSRMSNRRIKETMGIRYDDVGKMSDIVRAVKSMLREHEAIDTNQTLIVNFNAFNASSLDFFIYTFTKTTNWVEFHEIKHDVMIRIADIVEQHGAEFAFPTRTLHVDGNLTEAAEQPA